MAHEITAFHGGELEGATWYTTDAGHAAIFGSVSSVRLSSGIAPVRLVASEVVGDLCGYKADAALWAHLAEIDATWAIVEGWEGDGECIIVREPHFVKVIAL